MSNKETVVKMESSTYKVYVLVKGKRPVYVGMTKDVGRRARKHRRLGKDFDKIKVIQEYRQKSKALIAENAIGRFIATFERDHYNKQFPLLDFSNVWGPAWDQNKDR